MKASTRFERALISSTAVVVGGGLTWSQPTKPTKIATAKSMSVSLSPLTPSVASSHSAVLPAAIGTTFLATLLMGQNKKKRSRRAIVRLAHKTMCKEADGPESFRQRFEAVLAAGQEHICKTIEEFDGGAKFCYEQTTRPGGGGGLARVLKDGNVFEKAGCNLSVVYGDMPQEALRAANDCGASRTSLKPGEKVPFFACGLSSVMHPRNPFCPTMHFNYRYFETEHGSWWFGGGTDITPSYLDRNDMKHFHGVYKQICDKYNKDWYPKFKEWADDYFCIAHRGETRGLGGIFFDDFNSEDKETHLNFSRDCLQGVTEAYVPVLANNRNKEFTQEQKDWQQIRRGRYVELNLVYDRGTIFGLKMLPTGTGKIESILMSLPETARWEYCHEPSPGTPEAEILEAFRKPQQWV